MGRVKAIPVRDTYEKKIVSGNYQSMLTMAKSSLTIFAKASKIKHIWENISRGNDNKNTIKNLSLNIL